MCDSLATNGPQLVVVRQDNPLRGIPRSLLAQPTASCRSQLPSLHCWSACLTTAQRHQWQGRSITSWLLMRSSNMTAAAYLTPPCLLASMQQSCATANWRRQHTALLPLALQVDDRLLGALVGLERRLCNQLLRTELTVVVVCLPCCALTHLGHCFGTSAPISRAVCDCSLCCTLLGGCRRTALAVNAASSRAAQLWPFRVLAWVWLW